MRHSAQTLGRSVVALATPFTEEAEVDFKAFEDLILWHIAEGTDAIVVCGTTGEAPTLDFEEQLQLWKIAVSASCGQVPIIAGTGSYNTRCAVEKTEAAQACGTSASLQIFPYYNRPTPEGCFAHFQEIAQVGLPMILYHHPGRTGIKIPVKQLEKICALPEVIGFKDSSGDIDYAVEFMHSYATPFFLGDDTPIVPLLSAGACGVVSVVCNLIPRQWKQLIDLLAKGEIFEARRLFARYYPLCKALTLETNPQCVKYGLSLLGKCTPTLRLPLIPPTTPHKLQIEAALSTLNLIPSPLPAGEQAL